MKKFLSIIILFPIFIYAQDVTISEFIFTDSFKINSFQQNLGIENEIFTKIKQQEINLFRLNQTEENCLDLKVIQTTENIRVKNNAVKNDLVEIFITDYLMVYKDSSNLEIHHMYDGFSDSVIVKTSGDVVYIVNGRENLERLFTFNDIEKVYFLNDSQTNQLIAFSFKYRLNFIGLENAWFKVDNFNKNNAFQDLMTFLKAFSEKSKRTEIGKLKMCD